jgi:RNA polymerase sigma-70 factor (ECF subfamily)
MEACQNYLLLVANKEINGELRAKGGASDIVQDTFLEAQRDFPRFEGKTEAEFRGWLRRLLLNNVSNFARRYRTTGKRNLRREIAIEQREDSASEMPLKANGPSPSAHMMAAEEKQALLSALDLLPNHYREVIVLRHREGLGYQEIAERLNRSPEAVRKLWARGIELLQTYLHRGGVENGGPAEG